MKVSIATSMLAAVLLLPGVAAAQLHGTHEPIKRSREPGLREGTMEAVIAGALEHAHKAEAWRKQEAASFLMQLQLADNEPLGLYAVFATAGPAFILSVNGEPVLGHDGEKPWETPVVETLGDAAVHLRMLSRLPALPYRLHDSRNIYNITPLRVVNDRRCHVMSIQSTENDDWTVLLVDAHTNLLHAAAYFIRTSEDDEAAFSPAFAMVADGHEHVCDVPLPTAWQIWRWSRPRGTVGEEPIGTVKVREAKFVDVGEGTFTAPEQAANSDAADVDGGGGGA